MEFFQRTLERRSQFKEKLRGRARVFGSWTSLGDPQITEILAKPPVDFVGIDIEHGTSSYAECQRIIAAAQSNGRVCLPRIASHNMEMLKRLLDSGADGAIVPMVDTAEQAEQIVSWIKYPPLGARSFGMNRGQDYGFGFDEYVKSWNRDSSVILQIESIRGVENIDKILANVEVDAVMIGPYDLSGTMGIPGQLDHPRVQEAAQHVLQACKAKGRGCGTHVTDPDLQSVQVALDRGYTFVVLASDIFLMWKWAKQMTALVEQVRR